MTKGKEELLVEQNQKGGCVKLKAEKEPGM